MNCTRAQENFADLLDHRLSEADTAEVRAHLATCPDCQREYAALTQTLAALDNLPAPKPSPRLRANFYAMLEEEKNSAASAQAVVTRHRRTVRWLWFLSPIAACALAFGGFYAGTHYAPPAPAPSDDTAALKRELAEQRRQLAAVQSKLNNVDQAVGYVVNAQRSASDRLQGILATLDQKNPDQKLLANLISSLALDPSVNVRLSAIDALYPHAQEQIVRTGILASLPREQSPLVQVALIDFLVAARDRDAAPELEKLARNDTIDVAVRDAAKRAVAML